MTQQATFAAGCFWGVQFYFDQVPGVTRTVAGYTGGHVPNPSYDQVATRLTGHAESVLVEFDPEQVSYATLVRHFFRLHDPTLQDSDGINEGPEYRSALFYHDKAQQKTAEAVRDTVQKTLKKPIVTECAPAATFYEAEPYHQKFTERTGIGMCHIPYAPLKK